ncbi:hypothetical protein ACN20G_27910 (plasmid) [Streptomyces sp. BI20]|uniref:hypothetical protein n=1 Tax=Streptomyces sp. BI20 TaxID=3403460 RepID=UPI003C7362BE
MTASRTDRGRAPRPGPRTAALLCAAAALAVAAAPAHPRTAPSPGPPVLLDCAAEPVVRPADYLLACGDGNSALADLRWSSWGPDRAEATGTNRANDCVPDCAAGRFRSHRVHVTLGDPEPRPGHPGQRAWTTIRLVYPDTAPGTAGHDVTVPLYVPS